MTSDCVVEHFLAESRALQAMSDSSLSPTNMGFTRCWVIGQNRLRWNEPCLLERDVLSRLSQVRAQTGVPASFR